jgi:hypothetical protein
MKAHLKELLQILAVCVGVLAIFSKVARGDEPMITEKGLVFSDKKYIEADPKTYWMITGTNTVIRSSFEPIITRTAEGWKITFRKP